MTRVSCVSIDLINADKPPAGLAFLAGACEKANVSYQCISLNTVLLKDLSTDQYNDVYSRIKRNDVDNVQQEFISSIDSVIDSIAEFFTDTVLVSVFSYMQHPLSVIFLTALRKKLPTVTVFAGGPGMYSNDEKITNGKKLLQAGLVDYYCLGEGDSVLPQWLSGKQNLIGVNSKKSLSETTVPQIDDLDQEYVLPSYKKIPTTGYTNLENKNSAIFSISTSRGCVRRCTFCDIGKSWPKFKYRSGKLVAQEILRHHQDVGATHFTIVDSLINGSLRNFQEFNEEMVNLKNTIPGLANFSYNGMFIVRNKQSHPESFFKLMKEAGCESLSIGVETGSDRLRFEMQKKFTNQDLDHHLEMCQKYGIKNAILMFVGYPTETQEDFEQSLLMLDRYQKYLIDDTIIGINHSGVYSLLPDTPIYDHRDSIGLEIEYNKSAVINWVNHNNPDLTVKTRLLRDIEFRTHALELRYPIPYADRYLSYLKDIDIDFVPVSD